MCPPDPAHTTLAHEGGDFIWTDTGTGADGHSGSLRDGPDVDCPERLERYGWAGVSLSWNLTS